MKILTLSVHSSSTKALLAAVHSGLLDDAEAALRLGANANAIVSGGKLNQPQPVLIYAIAQQNTELALVLIAGGASAFAPPSIRIFKAEVKSKRD